MEKTIEEQAAFALDVAFLMTTHEGVIGSLVDFLEQATDPNSMMFDSLGSVEDIVKAMRNDPRLQTLIDGVRGIVIE